MSLQGQSGIIELYLFAFSVTPVRPGCLDLEDDTNAHLG
jgi:hypothetical protein